MTSKHALRPVFVLLALIPFAACGGGASSGTSSVTVGLEGPGQVAVVTPDGGSTAPAGGVAPGASNFAPDSDYVTDQADVWVYDPSMEALETVNLILAQTSATAYAQMVNYGPYVAQVVAEEDKNSASSSTAGQSAGAQIEQFELFTVDSQRASNNQPQTVNFWVPENMNGMLGPNALIYAQMTLNGGATEINPFGDFHMNFALSDGLASIGTPLMFGSLATSAAGAGNIGFNFYSETGDVTQPVGPGQFADKIQVSVTMSADQTTGVAKILQLSRWYDDWLGADSGLMTESWRVAFDQSYFKRQADSGAVTTLSRSNYTDNVWNYNLYYASGANAGQRVDLNSGFGFKVPSGEYGWIGYYGFWVPDGVTLTNGQTITEDVWDDTVIPATYTVVKAPGKLMRHSKNQMNLVDIGTTTFDFWDPLDGFQYLVTYHDALFWRTAKWDDLSSTWQTLPAEISIDLVTLGGWLNMWSSTLGGSVTYLEGSTYITYYSEEFINPSSAAFTGLVGDRLELFGYIDCLKANLTAADVEAGNVYLPNVSDVATPTIYRFDKSDMTLYYDATGDDSNSQVVGLSSGQVPTDGPFMWGMQSGPMVSDTTGIVNPWDLWDLPEFYTYETGHNEWNQYGAVVDSLGAPVVFDAPLQFLYTHSTANDRNADTTYDGEAYFLEYNGPGDLWGIPSDGVDLNGDSVPDRWYPLFSLADGVLLGPTGTEYVLRGIDMEQTMAETPGAAPTLDVTAADSLVLPTAADYATPTNGVEPTVTDPPAVIDGVVQVPSN